MRRASIGACAGRGCLGRRVAAQAQGVYVDCDMAAFRLEHGNGSGGARGPSSMVAWWRQRGRFTNQGAGKVPPTLAANNNRKGQ